MLFFCFFLAIMLVDNINLTSSAKFLNKNQYSGYGAVTQTGCFAEARPCLPQSGQCR